MRFGVCMPIEQAEFIAKLGFDYLEVSAAGLAEMTEAQFADFLQKNEAAPIHAEAANCMFPGSIKLRVTMSILKRSKHTSITP